ncbi:MAG: ATP-grasp fold amidoligase family protein [Paludibacteraceae bacterium]|nr:ATP-grasp fold amidoligase family protein [Paludibacteraceae bacterium]
MKRPFYNAIHSLFHNPKHFTAALLYRFGKCIPDETYLRWIYYLETGNRLNVSNPQRYNEKLIWLKLYYRDPMWTIMVDKYGVKQLVSERVGSEYVVPVLGRWNRAEEIEWDKLPNRFVLKTNHDSGNNGVFIIKDKSKIGREKLVRKINASLHRDTSVSGREWPYRDMKRCVFAEQYLEDTTGELRDYKFFCFDGKVKYLYVATERQSGNLKFNFFDEDFNSIDLWQSHPRSDMPIEKPAKYDEMKELAAKLSKGLPEVRVDLYEVNGRIYFGEYTFFSSDGTAAFHPDKWDFIWGEHIHLPKANNV